MFGETVCKLRALVAEMTSYASVLTIVAFSLERYLAICHPLLIQKVSSLSRAIKVVTGVWIGACLFAIPFAVFTKVNYLEYPNGTGEVLAESAFCALPMENNDVSLPLVQFSSIFFFCLPMTLIVVIYVKIGLKVRQSRFSARLRPEDSARSPGGQRRGSGGGGASASCGASGGQDNARTQMPPARKSIHKMLVAVVIAFFVCWAPFHTQRLFACFFHSGEWTVELRRLNEILYYTGGCLYYFSATINPILYSLLSVKYREAFRDALCSFGGTAQRGNARHRHKDFEASASRASLAPSPDVDRRSKSQKPYTTLTLKACNEHTLKVPNGHAVGATVPVVARPKEGPLRRAVVGFLKVFRVKKVQEDGRTVPVILVTGSSPELSPEARKEQQQDVLLKFRETTV